MAIPNLLTKLIVNINKLSYDKQEELFRISEAWIHAKQNASSTPPQPTGSQSESHSTLFVSKASNDQVSSEVTLFEERAYERKFLTVPIEFVEGGKLYKELTKDISAGGVFIKTKKHKKFSTGQKISMVFLLDDDQKPYKLSGTIVRVEDEGVAVKFENISTIECVSIEEELSNIEENNLP